MELATAFGVLGVRGAFSGDAVAVARISRNMRRAAFDDKEIAHFLRALYTSGTKQDARDAWAVLDRRRTGTISRHEVEDVLVAIFGTRCRRQIHLLLNRLPSAGSAYANRQTQMVEASEFTMAVPDLAQLGRGESLAGYLATETASFFSEATQGLQDAGRAWSALELETVSKVAPPLLPKAGAVAQRFLKAGYSAHDASTAVAALYGPRDTVAIARLWGLFDEKREGVIPGARFDAAMALLTEAIAPADMPSLRVHMGFVDEHTVTIHEFEAALRTIVPPDGSMPRLLADQSAEMSLPDLLGSVANVQRLKPFQRQRASRLCVRMKNFGYSRASITLLTRTLFLSKLHDRDLWSVWLMLHPKPPDTSHDAPAPSADSPGQARVVERLPSWCSEAPLEVEQVRHLLALLTEGEARKQVEGLVDKVDANRSGDIEFEELATLVRAISPANVVPKHDLADVEVEAHPLLAQVQSIADGATLNVMYATREQLAGAAARASKLGAVVRRLEGAYAAGAGGGDAPGAGGAPAGRRGHNKKGGLDKATLTLIHDTADAQLQMAAEGERRGSLGSYCSDTYAEALACLAQALRHAAALLEANGNNTYEAHVALRTLRTVASTETLQPSNKVDWCMRDVPSSRLGSHTEGGDAEAPAPAGERGRTLPGQEGSAALGNARNDGSSPSSSVAEGLRRRMSQIYVGGKGQGAGGRGQGAGGEEDGGTDSARRVMDAAAAHADLVAKAHVVAQRAFNTHGSMNIDDEKTQIRPSTHAVEMAKRRKHMLLRESTAAILADELRGEHENAIAYAARVHVSKQRSKDERAHRAWTVLGDHRTNEVRA